jgi:hypothetical protein
MHSPTSLRERPGRAAALVNPDALAKLEQTIDDRVAAAVIEIKATLRALT